MEPLNHVHFSWSEGWLRGAIPEFECPPRPTTTNEVTTVPPVTVCSRKQESRSLMIGITAVATVSRYADAKDRPTCPVADNAFDGALSCVELVVRVRRGKRRGNTGPRWLVRNDRWRGRRAQARCRTAVSRGRVRRARSRDHQGNSCRSTPSPHVSRLNGYQPESYDRSGIRRRAGRSRTQAGCCQGPGTSAPTHTGLP
jgi:hypothetical protein